MEAAGLLFRLLALLVAARIAAELAERLRLPAGLVEIAAGSMCTWTSTMRLPLAHDRRAARNLQSARRSTADRRCAGNRSVYAAR